ncbi:MAG: MarR family transcriptional regulator [Candidatus Heimdallarchaeota archaeon]|nr:MarR family transcriptional regulator [Candidatus Heimdallarchaeota archaeon]MCK5048341.1 MarR family transcriptional regulator [Candidatus Heimdallarchaeota archaeon]
MIKIKKLVKTITINYLNQTNDVSYMLKKKSIRSQIFNTLTITTLILLILPSSGVSEEGFQTYHVTCLANVTATEAVMNVTLSLVGTNETSRRGYIVIPLNSTEIEISDQFGAIEHTITTEMNITKITYNLSFDLLEGQSHVINLYCQTPIQIQGKFRQTVIGVAFDNQIGFISAVIRLNLGLSLYSSSISPHQIQPSAQGLKLSWSIPNTKSFWTTITYATSDDTAQLLITPTQWQVGTIKGTTVTQEFSVYNLGNTGVNISIFTPHYINIDLRKSTIKAWGNFTFKATIEGNNQKYADKIIISTNRTENSIEIPFEVTFEEVKESSQWVFILLGVIIGLAGLGWGAWTKYKTKIDQQEKVAKIPEKAVKTIPEKKLDFSKLLTRMSGQEVQALQAIYEEPGCNQASLGDKIGVSKATVSRIIGRLENKGFITKKQQGMSNSIFPTEKIEKILADEK